MKRLFLIIIIVFQFGITFSQNEYYNKNNLLLYAGYNHSFNFEPVYFSADTTYLENPESGYNAVGPAGYDYPYSMFNLKANYLLFMHKKINFNGGIHYTQLSRITTHNTDSILKHEILVDSLERYYNYHEERIPEYSKEGYYNFYMSWMLGYQYKRLNISVGVLIQIFGVFTDYREYQRMNKIYKKTSYKTLAASYFDIKLEFLIIKKILPTSIYLDISRDAYIGLAFNISKIKQ